MSDPKKKHSPSSNFLQTMSQTEDSQKVSQEISETEEFKQNAEAPRIPGYILFQTIGRGAYAQVWEAIQVRTRRFVAIKVFFKKAGVQWTFLQREVERLIRLDKHPNIVSTLDANLSASLPYYVMDLAREGSLEKFLDALPTGGPDPQTLERVVKWMEQIAGALSYVHSKQMVHCDLKPANVLLDEEGNIRLADFGHSRVTSDSGSALGTLFYMAPEQAIVPDPAHPLQPDSRWDIFAMGCTLYALLSGVVPHAESSSALEKIPDTAERLRAYRNIILETPLTPLHTLTKGKVDRDLSAIVAKCMSPNPLERYASITEVLKDLKNRREGKPVSPLAHDPAYWTGKFITRFWLHLLMALITLGCAFVAYLIYTQKEQAQLSDEAFTEILQGRDFLDKGDQPSAVAFFADSNKLFPSALARGSAAINMPPIPSHVMNQGCPLVGAWFTPDGKEILTAGEKGPLNLWDPNTGSLLRSFDVSGSLRAWALSSSAEIMAAAGSQGDILLLSLEGNVYSLGSLQCKEDISCLAISPDGKYILAGSEDGSAQIYNLKNGKTLEKPLQTGSSLISALFSPDSHRVLTLSRNGLAHLWNSDNGQNQGTPMKLDFKDVPSWYKPSMAYSPDGKTILIAGWFGNIRFFDKDGHRKGNPVYLEGLDTLFTPFPDGRNFLVNTINNGEGTVQLFSLRTRQISKSVFQQKGQILACVPGPNDKIALIAGTDHQAMVRNILTGKLLGRTIWQGDSITVAALSPSYCWAITGGNDGLVRLWDLSETGAFTQSDLAPIAKYYTAPIALFSHAGKWVATFGGKSVQIWNTDIANPIRKILDVPGRMNKALFSPDDSRLVLAGGKSLEWVNLSTGGIHPLELDSPALGMAFNKKGNLMAVLTKGGKLFLWNLPNGPLIGSPVTLGFKASRLVLQPDGHSVIVWRPGGSLACFSLFPRADSKPLWKVNKRVETAAFNPTGTRVAVAVSGTILFHSTTSGVPMAKSITPGGKIELLAYSPDGLTLLSLDADGYGKLWNTNTGGFQGARMNPPARVQSLVFSPGGECLAGIYGNGLLQFWDSQTGEPIGSPLHLNYPRGASFRSDSKAFLWLDPNGAFHAIDTSWLLSGRSPKDLILQAEVAGQVALNSHGSVDPIPSEDWLSLYKKYEER